MTTREDAVMDQAHRKARTVLDPVRHSMALEDQDVKMGSELERLAYDLVDRRGLWS